MTRSSNAATEDPFATMAVDAQCCDRGIAAVEVTHVVRLVLRRLWTRSPLLRLVLCGLRLLWTKAPNAATEAALTSMAEVEVPHAATEAVIAAVEVPDVLRLAALVSMATVEVLPFLLVEVEGAFFDIRYSIFLLICHRILTICFYDC